LIEGRLKPLTNFKNKALLIQQLLASYLMAKEQDNCKKEHTLYVKQNRTVQY